MKTTYHLFRYDDAHQPQPIASFESAEARTVVMNFLIRFGGIDTAELVTYETDLWSGVDMIDYLDLRGLSVVPKPRALEAVNES